MNPKLIAFTLFTLFALIVSCAPAPAPATPVVSTAPIQPSPLPSSTISMDLSLGDQIAHLYETGTHVNLLGKGKTNFHKEISITKDPTTEQGFVIYPPATFECRKFIKMCIWMYNGITVYSFDKEKEIIVEWDNTWRLWNFSVH